MTKSKNSISRRDFIKNSVVGTMALASASVTKRSHAQTDKPSLRMGGPVFEKYESPEKWVQILKNLGYRAAYCPVGTEASEDEIKAYAKAAEDADITIAEVGTWSNPISPNDDERKQALKKCRDGLVLADKIGAKCCVNVSGSRNPKRWAGPHEKNLTEETFDMIVETTQKLIDDVKPTRTHFTLEAMPWSYPDSPDSYVRLLKAVDRKQFAVHLDPMNFISSPQLYFNNAKLIRDCFAKLGPYIKSCHAKDIILKDDIYTPHLDEIRAGLGALDYTTFLKELSKFPDVPLMLEHLPDAEQYKLAADHIRSVAEKLGLAFT